MPLWEKDNERQVPENALTQQKKHSNLENNEPRKLDINHPCMLSINSWKASHKEFLFSFIFQA